MMTFIAICLFVVVGLPAIGVGATTAAIVICAVALVILWFASVCRKDARAHVNWMEYWAEGGPDREWRYVDGVEKTEQTRDRVR